MSHACFRDARGYFFESFSEREFKVKVKPLVGYRVEFCQDNQSMSSYGVMRGLHFQRPPFTQSKLMRCVKGRVITSITLKMMGECGTYAGYGNRTNHVVERAVGCGKMVLLADDAHRPSGDIQCAGYLNASILERELTYPEGELEKKREVDI